MPASRAELSDGTTILLRRMESGDAAAVLDLFEGLTDDERYFRFFTVNPDHVLACARSLTEPAPDRYALGAFSPDRLLGVANYVTCTSTGDAEVALVVAHDEHLRGVGTALLCALARIAKSHGVKRLIADVLAANQPMLHVLSDTGWPWARHRDGWVFHVELDLDEISAATTGRSAQSGR